MKLLIIVSVASVLLLAVSLFGCYMFIYNSNIKHMDVYSENIYNYLESKLDVTDFIREWNEFEHESTDRNTDVMREVMESFDIASVYTMKRLEDGKIIYLSYADREADRYAGTEDRYKEGNNVESFIADMTAEIFKNGKLSENGGLMSENDSSIYYFYPIYDSADNIIGALGIEFDADLIMSIINGKFAKFAGGLIILIFILVMLYITVFNKFLSGIITTIVYTDDLTKLKNRAAYEEYIEKLNTRIKSDSSDFGEKLFILIFDLNNLKQANDNLGHLAGDKYIKDAGNLINKCFKNIGRTFRVGGDEFTTIIEDSSSDIVVQCLDKLSSEESLYNQGSKSIFMSISVGWDYFKPGYDINITTVLKRADEKMYKDKKSKKLNMSQKELNDSE